MGARGRTLLAAAATLAAIAIPASPARAGDGGVCFECEKPEETDGFEEVLTLGELRTLARDVGFAKPKLAAAIAMAESSGYVRAVNRNRRRRPPRSIDRGLFQINSRWHPEVSRRCAFDALCNAEEAYRISEGGRDWHQWTTWHTGAYRAYL